MARHGHTARLCMVMRTLATRLSMLMGMCCLYNSGIQRMQCMLVRLALCSHDACNQQVPAAVWHAAAYYHQHS